MVVVGFIDFHEEAVKFWLKYISVLGCGVGSGFHADSMWWSMFRSNLPQNSGTLPSGYRSVYASTRCIAIVPDWVVLNVLPVG